MHEAGVMINSIYFINKWIVTNINRVLFQLQVRIISQSAKPARASVRRRRHRGLGAQRAGPHRHAARGRRAATRH